MDKIIITVMKDGLIRTETDPISPANHTNAEEFLKDMARRAGGVEKIEKRHSQEDPLLQHEHGKKQTN